MNKFKRLLTLALLPLLLPIFISALPATSDQKRDEEIAARLTGSILIGNHSMNYLHELSDRFGARLSGSPAYQRSAEWAAEQFRALGLKNVRLETFTMSHGWQRGWARAQMLAPLNQPLHIESLGWTPSTPAGGVKGEVYLISDITAQGIKAQAEKIKGRIVLFDMAAIYANGGRRGSYKLRSESYPLLKEAGALAVLNPEMGENSNLLNARNALFNGQVPVLPVATIGMEDEKLIRRLSERQAVTIEFQYENKLTTGPIQINNVIAELPGREQPDEWVLIGAHLDSWDFATGAQDNGTGCASVLDAARAIMALGQAPRRSIRFALWGGEEQGLLGSEAYVQQHTNELAKCVAVLNTDNGAGHPKGWKVQGRQDLSNAMKPISEMMTSLGGNGLSMQMTYDTDHGPFFLAGIPALDLWVDMSHYDDVHHKTSDTADKVDPHSLSAATAIIAITGYTIADRPQPIVGHASHDAIGEILRANGMEQYMIESGVWKK